jgi:hypothetical protein
MGAKFWLGNACKRYRSGDLSKIGKVTIKMDFQELSNYRMQPTYSVIVTMLFVFNLFLY